MKVPKRLASLIEEGRIDKVVRQLMSGKEATVYVVRLGYSALLLQDRLAAGALGEFLTTEDRGDTWRVGPMLDYRFTDHFSATLVYTVPAASPDSLGPWTGSWGTVRVRYALATGEARPAFP